MNPVSFYKCLAEETRLKSLLLIEQEGELCVCELVCALDMSQPKISRHLAQLRACSLLEDRRMGQWVYYRLHPQLPEWVRQVLMLTRSENSDFLEQASGALGQMQGRPGQNRCC